MSLPSQRPRPVSRFPLRLLRPPGTTDGAAVPLTAEEAVPLLRGWCMRDGQDRVAAVLRRALPSTPPVRVGAASPLWLSMEDAGDTDQIEREPTLMDALEAAADLGGPEAVLRPVRDARDLLAQEVYP